MFKASTLANMVKDFSKHDNGIIPLFILTKFDKASKYVCDLKFVGLLRLLPPQTQDKEEGLQWHAPFVQPFNGAGEAANSTASPWWNS